MREPRINVKRSTLEFMLRMLKRGEYKVVENALECIVDEKLRAEARKGKEKAWKEYMFYASHNFPEKADECLKQYEEFKKRLL